MRSPETMMSVTTSMWSTGSSGPSTGVESIREWAEGERRGGSVGDEEQQSSGRHASDHAGVGELVQDLPCRSQRRQSERSHDVVEAAGRMQVVTSWAAAENSRSRSRLGSQRRAGPVRASIGGQASRSSGELDDLQPYLVLGGAVEGEVAQAGVAGRSGALAVPQLQLGDRCAGGIASEAGQAQSTGTGKAQLRAGVRSFRGRSPHPAWPSGEERQPQRSTASSDRRHRSWWLSEFALTVTSI
jgi:hypothetical protein